MGRGLIGMEEIAGFRSGHEAGYFPPSRGKNVWSSSITHPISFHGKGLIKYNEILSFYIFLVSAALPLRNATVIIPGSQDNLCTNEVN
jgi:hypothetical protein